MDYVDLKEELSKLSLFELHRLEIAIYNELDNPSKIAQIQNSIAVGGQIEYLHDATNCIISAIILQKNPKRLLVKNCHNQEQWWIRYHTLNLSTTMVKPILQKMSKNDASVGDEVGFEYDGKKIMGKIVKLNPKTASILTSCNHKWRVSYNLLFPIIETAQHMNVIDI